MMIFEEFSNLFWTENFWFPENVTWLSIIEKRELDGMFLPLPRDLWIALPVAVGLFLLRLIWERFVATHVGRYFAISEALPKKAPQNPTLEVAYRKHGKRATRDVFEGLSKRLDWSVRKVERWWRTRRNQGKASEMQRFCETSWRFLFYLSIFWYGLYATWDKPYFWDTRHCWYGYPYQVVPLEISRHIIVELSFYLSLVLSLSMDVKRKDFVEMMIHHAATITLLLISWSINMARIGSLILVLHDAVDFWLEGGKLAKYCKWHRLCDPIFVLFTLIWLVTRIIIYPMKILNSTLVESWQILGPHGSYYVYNTLLVTLQLLHVIWFIMILKIAYNFLTAGKLEDERSDSEYVESEEEESPPTDGNQNYNNKKDLHCQAITEKQSQITK